MEYMFAILVYISLLEYISYLINKVILYGEYLVILLGLVLAAFSLWVFLIMLNRYVVSNEVSSLAIGDMVRSFGKEVLTYTIFFIMLPIVFVVILYQLRISFLLDSILRRVFTGVNEILITVPVILISVILPAILTVLYITKKIRDSLKKTVYY